MPSGHHKEPPGQPTDAHCILRGLSSVFELGIQGLGMLSSRAWWAQHAAVPRLGPVFCTSSETCLDLA